MPQFRDGLLNLCVVVHVFIIQMDCDVPNIDGFFGCGLVKYIGMYA